MSFGVSQISFKIYRHKYLGSKYAILSIMLSFAKMTLFYFFFIKSISKSKMDILILSILEILKKVLKKICNLHIVTATYFYCILNILIDDKRSCLFIVFYDRIIRYSDLCQYAFEHNMQHAYCDCNFNFFCVEYILKGLKVLHIGFLQ